ncbi:acetate kinase [Buchnera aphidicola]|uniref:acetate kinase n=1 Tax=Buchnera aphidicola TaxID=9 RepID=UPI0034646293
MISDLVLVLNCGSSSLKFSILDPKKNKKYLFGLVDRLYLSETYVIWNYKNKKNKIIIGDYIKHKKSLKFIIRNIFFKYTALMLRVKFIGHRVVHGGYKIKQSVIITDNIIQEIKKNIIFSPVHNPINLLGIVAAIKYFPSLSKRNVAVLDTTFYTHLPEFSYLYAIPYIFYKKYHIRKYGAHGISHAYVSQEAAKMLNVSINTLNIISCHLGSGSSVTAICNGVSVDTSMGLTPLEGLVMGTRSGDLDPSIIFFMHHVLNIDITEIENILLKKSGILGLTNGITSDFRDIEKNYDSNKESYRAVNVFCHRLSKYIGAYSVLLQGKLDAIIFTGGIGENSALVRKITLSKLSLLNIYIDDNLNNDIKFGKQGYINKKNTIPVLVIPTNEELLIAKETIKLFKKT